MTVPFRPEDLQAVLRDAGEPSSRAGGFEVSPALRMANPARVRYRVQLVWRDPTTRSGQRVEVRTFGSPRALLDLLRRVSTTPHRPLISIALESIVRPRWERVPLDFVRWRAAQHERRAAEKRDAR